MARHVKKNEPLRPEKGRRTSASSYKMAEGKVRDSGSILDGGRLEKQREKVQGEASTTKKKHPKASLFQGRNVPKRNKKPNPIRRIINNWFDRVMGAVSEGSLADQEEEYASGRTSRDFVWNSLGQAAWGFVFPLLTIVVTQLVGVENAGIFSFVFVIANLTYFIGCYGVRTYQVSDLDEFHSFSDYQFARVLTCVAMFVVSMIVLQFIGLAPEFHVMAIGIFIYKTIDALGEVYEGRLQQVDKLYLGGISLAVRSFGSLLIFSIILFVTHNLSIAAVGMAVVAVLSFIALTLPLTLLETSRSFKVNMSSVSMLLKECFPVFAALFLYALIDNLPKFVMQGANLAYDNQLYFNALYFPAQSILIIVQLIYRPLLVKIAHIWNDRSRRARFDILIIAMLVVIVAISIAAAIFMAYVGVPIMSIMYGIDFEPYKQYALIMIAAGGLTAAIDFLYQIITIMRKQKVVLSIYLMTFGFSLVVLILMTTMMQFEGAVMGYLIVMSILSILLIREYISQRIKASRSGRR